jgi:hypothetical protein
VQGALPAALFISAAYRLIHSPSYRGWQIIKARVVLAGDQASVAADILKQPPDRDDIGVAIVHRRAQVAAECMVAVRTKQVCKGSAGDNQLTHK